MHLNNLIRALLPLLLASEVVRRDILPVVLLLTSIIDLHAREVGLPVHWPDTEGERGGGGAGRGEGGGREQGQLEQGLQGGVARSQAGGRGRSGRGGLGD